MKLKIKVCGMKNQENIAQIEALQPDYMGFIFYPKSLRYIEDLNPLNLPKQVKRVGVFVNEDVKIVKEQIKKYALHTVQLHGTEDVNYCTSLKSEKVEIIKAFGVDDTFDFEQLKPYLDKVDYFLFDTQTSQHGGSGKTFNWCILEKYPYDKPYFLSGGIDIGHVDNIKKITDNRLYALDINSKFELEPGLKDVNKVKEFINAF